MVLVVFCVGLVGLLLAGCGGSDDDVSPPPDYAKMLAGAPAPLAALHKQGDELLPGGLDAFNSRIDELKGYPAVVNVWASWCGPCRAEFPYFQQLSAKLGKKVAFFGVNSEDSDDLAADFLSTHQVPYPSYTDPKREIANDLGARGFPSTVFFDENGKQTNIRIGAFPDQASLEQAIQQYAIEGKSG